MLSVVVSGSVTKEEEDPLVSAEGGPQWGRSGGSKALDSNHRICARLQHTSIGILLVS